MSIRKFREFLAVEESGGYTIWFVIWFFLFSAFGGLTIDVSNALRNETQLQATADASALAGAKSLPSDTAAVNAAIAYARSNLTPDPNGHVVLPSDVKVGYWDFDTETFYTDADEDPNAVWVVSNRSDRNQNPLATTFLRLIGIDRFQVKAQAVAVQYIPECIQDGIVARGMVDVSSNNHFTKDICVHGQDHFEAQVNNGGPKDDCKDENGVLNCYDPGVIVSMSDFDNWKQMDKFANEEKNPGLPAALREYDLDAKMVDDLTKIFAILQSPDKDGTMGLAANVVPSYVTTEVAGVKTFSIDRYSDGKAFDAAVTKYGVPLSQVGSQFKSDTNRLWIDEVADTNNNALTPASNGKIIIVNCKNPKTDVLHFPKDYVFMNFVLVADCAINLDESLFTNVTMAAMGGKTNKDGSPDVKDTNISFTGGPVLGLADDCAKGGGVHMYTQRSVHMSAKMGAYGLQIVAGGDVHIAAQADAASGVNVQAGGDVKITSNNTWGICPNDDETILTSWYYRLVR